ncbi:uncharacterized protein EV154DRAFT_386950, partial [Mucor mucedo]|uniref:uncharacterized protein n=1 Tax=Mucor mucedo TaxID=29922 RepID=UPI0022206242
ANGQLYKSGQNDFKPDFLEYNLSGSVKCIALNSLSGPRTGLIKMYAESDLVKLAKQMKLTLNALVVNGVSMPKVCGIHCEGEN